SSQSLTPVGSSFNVTQSSGATGLLLSGGDLAVALFKPTVGTDSYYAVRASLDSVSLPGLDLGVSSDAFSLSASGYRIEVNGGSNNAAVNFASLPGGKLTVPVATSTRLTLATSGSTTITDGTDSAILRAGADQTAIATALGSFASFGRNPANVQVTP